ncbi:MAG: SGNH/GDSL hydrolase family protein [Planctomycetota bacterium]
MRLRLRWLMVGGLIALTAGAGAPPAKNNLKVVMLGDSVTLSKHNPAGQKLCDYVGKALETLSKEKGGPAWTVVNQGVGSETVGGGQGRVAGILDREKPDVITVCYGLNDTGLRDPAWFREHLAGLVEIVGKHPSAPRIMLVTTTPFDNKRHGWGSNAFYIQAGGLDRYLDREINGITRAFAFEKNLPLCDLHRHFLRDPKHLQYLTGDGVHLVPEGNEYAGTYIARCLYEMCRARVAGDADRLKTEGKVKPVLEKARKALRDPLNEQSRRETQTALEGVWELCPYLPESVVLLDELAKSQEARPQGSQPRDVPAKK